MDVGFEGDPRVTPDRRRRPLLDDAEPPVVRLQRGAAGGWTFHHDVRLEAD